MKNSDTLLLFYAHENEHMLRTVSDGIQSK